MYLISSPMLLSIIIAVIISISYMAYTVIVAKEIDKDDETF